MASIKTFKELKVWQEAHTLLLQIYKQTNDYPKHELFSLTSQTRRSCHSVPTNIVEGFRRKDIKESVRFYNIADASLEELKYHLLVAKDLRYVPCEQYEIHLKQCEIVGSMLTRWIQSQRKYV
jgi:four helix bundle protein